MGFILSLIQFIFVPFCLAAITYFLSEILKELRSR